MYQFQKLPRMFLSSLVWSFLLILTILVIAFLENATASEDIFGIEEIYPRKKGVKNDIDIINPLADSRFYPYNLLVM